MPLDALFEKTQSSTFSDDQGPWRQYILDHLDNIRKTSETFVLDGPLMNLYRFDLRRFLYDKMNRHEDLTWIVLLINDIPSELEFVNIDNLIVPTDSLITKLYHSYRTNVANST